MANDFYRSLDIPFFEDADFIKELETSVSYKIDRRLFDDTFYGSLSEMPISRNVLIPVWDFCLRSRVLLTPIFFRVLKPRSHTPTLIAVDPVATNHCLIDIPILQTDTGHKVLFHRTNPEGQPQPDLILVKDGPILFGNNSTYWSMSNDSDVWMVSLVLLFHARYDLIVELLERNMLFDDNEVCISEKPQI